MSACEMYHRIVKGKDIVANVFDDKAWMNQHGGPWTGDLERADIAQSTIVDITNVCDYYFETAPKPVWTLDEDFKGVTPPFDYMWFEAPIPKRQYDFKNETWVYTRDRGRMARALNFGIMVKRRDVRPEYLREHAKTELTIRASVPVETLPPGFYPKNPIDSRRYTVIEAKESLFNARWNVRMWGLIELPEYVFGPITVHDFYLDEKGDPIVEFPQLGLLYAKEKFTARTSSFTSYPQGASVEQIEFVENEGKSFSPFTDAAFLALSFMNCRNVTLRQVATKALTKKQQRRGDAPRLSHHVIEIQAMKPRYASVPATTSSHLQLAQRSLHIVRGHFKHYGPEWGTKKLFGRVSGKFWWDKHTAGSIDAGMVDSEYSVTP